MFDQLTRKPGITEAQAEAIIVRRYRSANRSCITVPTTETIAGFLRRHMPTAPVPAGSFTYFESQRDLVAENANRLGGVARANLLRALEIVGDEMDMNLVVAVRFHP